jgi:hypothetical protein
MVPTSNEIRLEASIVNMRKGEMYGLYRRKVLEHHVNARTRIQFIKSQH